MSLTDWPDGFERGLPESEGCYAVIVKTNLNPYCELAIVEVEGIGKLAADELGMKPGLVVVSPEGEFHALDDYGIVGYHYICESAWNIAVAKGFKEPKVLKLNKAGLGFYLDYYRHELEKVRVAEWPDGDIPPAPVLLPPMPQYSRSFFDEAKDE